MIRSLVLRCVCILATLGLCSVSCNDDEEVVPDTEATTTTTDCDGGTQIEKVVCLSNQFLATLSSSQKSSAVITLNLANAKRWSNLPCG